MRPYPKKAVYLREWRWGAKRIKAQEIRPRKWRQGFCTHRYYYIQKSGTTKTIQCAAQTSSFQWRERDKKTISSFVGGVNTPKGRTQLFQSNPHMTEASLWQVILKPGVHHTLWPRGRPAQWFYKLHNVSRWPVWKGLDCFTIQRHRVGSKGQKILLKWIHPWCNFYYINGRNEAFFDFTSQTWYMMN